MLYTIQIEVNYDLGSVYMIPFSQDEMRGGIILMY